MNINKYKEYRFDIKEHNTLDSIVYQETTCKEKDKNCLETIVYEQKRCNEKEDYKMEPFVLIDVQFVNWVKNHLSMEGAIMCEMGKVSRLCPVMEHFRSRVGSVPLMSIEQFMNVKKMANRIYYETLQKKYGNLLLKLFYVSLNPDYK